MPNTNEGVKSVRIWARVTRPTYDALVAAALQRGLFKGRINIGAILEMVAAQLDSVLAQAPAPRRFDRGRKLSPDQVRLIRASTDKFAYIAHEHGISTSTVLNVRHRKNYEWVK